MKSPSRTGVSTAGSARSVASSCCKFRQARSRLPLPDGVLAVGRRDCGHHLLHHRHPLLPDSVMAVGRCDCGHITSFITDILSFRTALWPWAGATAAISPPSSPTPSPSGQLSGRGRHDRRRPVCGTSACAWNIAVRTRGVFTHRDDFQKPACAERGLVRTGIALGRPGLVSTESQSFQNQRPSLPPRPRFQSPPPIPFSSPPPMCPRSHRRPVQ